MSLEVGDIVEIKGIEGKGKFRILEFRAYLENLDNPSEKRHGRIEDLVKISDER